MTATITPKTRKKSLIDTQKVLILNKSWMPIETVSLRRAMRLVFRQYSDGEPTARIIDPVSYQAMDWSDWSKLIPDQDRTLWSAEVDFRIPEIIVLTRYDKIPKAKDSFSRRELLKRDHFQCQYCSCELTHSTFTLDHVIPQVQGGKTTWDNTVACCFNCNVKKGGRTPAEAGMKLLSIPKKPNRRFRHLDLSQRVDSWQSFLGELYWTVPLQD